MRLLPLLLLPACAVAPPPQDVTLDVEVPAAWTGASDRDGAVDDTWWRGFGEPLSDLVDEALMRNHDLRAAASRVAAAAVQARLAGADLYPQLNAGLQGTRQRQNFIGLPIPGTSGPLSRTYSSFGLSLNASWELDLWGRIRAGRSAALGDLEAANADLRAAQLSLAAQTAKVWFAAVEAQLQQDLAARTVATYATTQERVRDRYERGVRPAVDLRLARNNLASAEALVQARREQNERTRRQLELLLGRYPAGSVRTAADLPALPPTAAAGLPSELLTRRPDLVSAERRLAAAGARVDAARAALFPRISLTSSAGTASDSLSDLLDSDFFVWNFAGNLLQPLFEGGRLRGQIELSEAQREELAELYAQRALNAYTEVESALVAEDILRQREIALTSALAEASAAQELSDQRYRDGLAEFVTVLDAQRRALTAESELLSVRRQRLDVRVDLHLALGGGFPNTQTRP